eukprot:GEMP01006056.1.p1 GENE.GEMP01006056.1~~GEMP01006056.1.p1  ORF type:complete len:1109 (+),score=142.23 GEMP01006056.1:155-3481(+)
MELALLSTVPSALWHYHRSNYLYDAKVSQTVAMKHYHFQVMLFGQFRSDIRRLWSITKLKMENIQVLSTIQLGLTLHLFALGKPARDEYVSAYLLGLFNLSIAVSISFLLLAMWFSMHCDLASHADSLHLLLSQVRLPIPTAELLEEVVAKADNFEKSKDNEVYRRVPYLQSPKEVVAREKQRDERAKRSSFATNLKNLVYAQPEQIPFLQSCTSMDKLRHVQAFKVLQEFWLSYDVYARVCLSIGSYSFLHTLCFFCLFADTLHGATASAIGCVVITLMASYNVIRVDMIQVPYFLMEIFFSISPVIVIVVVLIEGRNQNHLADDPLLSIISAIAYLTVAFYYVAFWRVCSPTATGLPKHFRSAVIFLDLFNQFNSNDEKKSASHLNSTSTLGSLLCNELVREESSTNLRVVQATEVTQDVTVGSPTCSNRSTPLAPGCANMTGSAEQPVPGTSAVALSDVHGRPSITVSEHPQPRALIDIVGNPMSRPEPVSTGDAPGGIPRRHPRRVLSSPENDVKAAKNLEASHTNPLAEVEVLAPRAADSPVLATAAKEHDSTVIRKRKKQGKTKAPVLPGPDEALAPLVYSKNDDMPLPNEGPLAQPTDVENASRKNSPSTKRPIQVQNPSSNEGHTRGMEPSTSSPQQPSYRNRNRDAGLHAATIGFANQSPAPLTSPHPALMSKDKADMTTAPSSEDNYEFAPSERIQHRERLSASLRWLQACMTNVPALHVQTATELIARATTFVDPTPKIGRQEYSVEWVAIDEDLEGYGEISRFYASKNGISWDPPTHFVTVDQLFNNMRADIATLEKGPPVRFEGVHGASDSVKDKSVSKGDVIGVPPGWLPKFEAEILASRFGRGEDMPGCPTTRAAVRINATFLPWTLVRVMLALTILVALVAAGVQATQYMDYALKVAGGYKNLFSPDATIRRRLQEEPEVIFKSDMFRWPYVPVELRCENGAVWHSNNLRTYRGREQVSEPLKPKRSSGYHFFPLSSVNGFALHGNGDVVRYERSAVLDRSTWRQTGKLPINHAAVDIVILPNSTLAVATAGSVLIIREDKIASIVRNSRKPWTRACYSRGNYYLLGRNTTQNEEWEITQVPLVNLNRLLFQ